jgi:hypothetical protein
MFPFLGKQEHFAGKQEYFSGNQNQVSRKQAVRLPIGELGKNNKIVSALRHFTTVSWAFLVFGKAVVKFGKQYIEPKHINCTIADTAFNLFFKKKSYTTWL